MMHRLIDPRSGLVFDIHEFGHQPGAMKEIVHSAPAPEGLGNDVIGVPVSSPIDLKLTLQAVGDGILATGVAGVQLRGECARCLSPIEATTEIDVQELFLFPGVDPDDTEASRVEGDLVDLEPVISDTVVLDLPFIPLCSDDCEGLCPTCGANLNDAPGHAHDETTDPRWADLAGWTDDQEQMRP